MINQNTHKNILSLLKIVDEFFGHSQTYVVKYHDKGEAILSNGAVMKLNSSGRWDHVGVFNGGDG